MFVDAAKVTVKAGDGGNGVVSFRHEKFVDRGGPDGGDGGDGGDVVFEASRNQDSLSEFRYTKAIVADSGKPGGKQKKRGKSADDITIQVPVGTVLTHAANGELIVDLASDGQSHVVARGGKGGFGNAHFTSSTRQAPRIAEKGEPGDELEVSLELKLIADVGLVGLPNAGKSTLLSVLSNAKPEIANYPFTTLTPNLGVVDVPGKPSLLMADIPGLIEGASQGKGLGDAFLRHVERTMVLIHLIDAYQDDVAGAYRTIQTELENYQVDLSSRPQVVVITKTEGLDADILQDLMEQLRSVVPADAPLFAISAAAKTGLGELLQKVSDLVESERQRQEEQAASQLAEHEDGLPVITMSEHADTWHIKKHAKGYTVTGPQLERFAHRTDFDSVHAVERLRDILRKKGVMHELERQGIDPGEKISIADIGAFEY
jgi:GTPase